MSSISYPDLTRYPTHTSKINSHCKIQTQPKEKDATQAAKERHRNRVHAKLIKVLTRTNPSDQLSRYYICEKI